MGTCKDIVGKDTDTIGICRDIVTRVTLWVHAGT